MYGNLVLLLLALSAHAKDYTGYKIVDVFPETQEHGQYLEMLQIMFTELDFWTEPRRMQAKGSILVPPKRVDDIVNALTEEGIRVDIRDTDVQKNIDTERELMAEQQAKKDGQQRAYDYNTFNRYSDFIEEINNLAASCPAGLTCTASDIGTSSQGRALRKIVLSTGSGHRALWIDSLIHAREWLAGATSMYILRHMVTSYGTDTTVTTLLNSYDFHFLPVLNPDGYEYSHTNDRYWRKNRRGTGGCIGTDLNRNFNYLWGREGVSHDPCSEIFCGPSAASEPETQVVQNEINRIGGGNMNGFLTIHSYAYVWLFPFSHTVNHNGAVCVRAPDHAALMAVADAAADATEGTHNTDLWDRGNGCEVLGALTGASDEWAKGAANVKYAYTIELRGSDFVIAPGQIQPSAQEVWNGIVAWANAIGANPPK